jgi:hypothetical protein
MDFFAIDALDSSILKDYGTSLAGMRLPRQYIRFLKEERKK